MIGIFDKLAETGTEYRLKAIQEVALLLPYVDWNQYQDVEQGELYYFPLFVRDALQELFRDLKQIEKEQDKEWRELWAKVPVDPEEEARRLAEDQKIAVKMAELIDKTVPGVSDKVRELIEKATAKNDVKQTAEDTSTGEPKE